MPDIAQVLKKEISRLARKEARTCSDPLHKQLRELRESLNQQRDAIDALARKVDQLSVLSSTPTEKILEAPDIEDTSKIRLSPDSIRRHRKRLNLSQEDLGKLLEVSANTVVRWEAGTSRPRARHRTGLAQLRTMGVRQVRKMLEAL